MSYLHSIVVVDKFFKLCIVKLLRDCEYASLIDDLQVFLFLSFCERYRSFSYISHLPP